MDTLREELRTYIIENIMFGQNVATLRDNTSFIESGLIDSTGVLDLVGYIESRFDLKVANTDLVPENFDTITGILHYIERHALRQCC